jgi:hypothetical protein
MPSFHRCPPFFAANALASALRSRSESTEDKGARAWLRAGLAQSHSAIARNSASMDSLLTLGDTTLCFVVSASRHGRIVLATSFRHPIVATTSSEEDRDKPQPSKRQPRQLGKRRGPAEEEAETRHEIGRWCNNPAGADDIGRCTSNSK